MAKENGEQNGASEKRFDKADTRADHFEQKVAADQFAMEQQAITLVGNVQTLTSEVQDLRTTLTRRNQLLLIVGTFVIVVGLAFLGVLFRVNFAVNEVRSVGERIDRQTVVNEINNLEHRVRHEKCVVEPILKIFNPQRNRNDPLPFLDECERENIPDLQRRLNEARGRIRMWDANHKD